MTSRPHDALFKETFSNVDNARGELRSILPADVAARIEWDSLRLEPGTFVDVALREKITDLLFSARISGREVRLYLLFEHQSSPDDWMPLRAYEYLGRIWRTWLRDHPSARRLPPIIPVLLAQVEGGWTGPMELAELIDYTDAAERDAFEHYVPSLRLLVDDLAGLTDARLDARPLPTEAKLTLALLRDLRSASDELDVLARWDAWIREVARADRDAFKRKLRYIVLVRPGRDVERFAEAARAIDPEGEHAIMSTMQELIQQGEAKGRAEGELRGRAETLLKLLRLRFGAPPASVVERIAGADVATLDRWVERVLTAASMEEVLAG